MRKQKLGKDLQVSAVGLGCMGMTHAYGKPADKEEMKKLIVDVVKQGCNFLIRLNVILELMMTEVLHIMKNLLERL